MKETVQKKCYIRKRCYEKQCATICVKTATISVNEVRYVIRVIYPLFYFLIILS